MSQTVLFTVGTQPAGWVPLARDLLQRTPPGVDLALPAFSKWVQQASDQAVNAGHALADWATSLPPYDPLMAELADVAGERKASWGGLDPHATALLPLLATVYPRASYLLLVDDPASALAQAMLAEDGVDPEAVLNRWTDTARLMLRHLHAHTGRCLVLDATEIRQERGLAAVVCRERTGIALREPGDTAPPLPAPDPVALFLAEELAAQHAASAAVHAELQAACLPLVDSAGAGQRSRMDVRVAVARLRVLELARASVERCSQERDAAEAAAEQAGRERDAALGDAAEVLARQHAQQELLAKALLERDAVRNAEQTLQKRLQALQVQHQATEDRAAEAQARVDALLQEAEIARRLLDSEAQTAASLRNQLVEAQANQSTAVRHRDELQRQLERKNEALASLQAKFEASTAEHNRLGAESQAQLAAAEAVRQRLQQSLDSTSAERDQLQAESQAQVAAAEAVRQRLQQSLDSTIAERDQLQAESQAQVAAAEAVRQQLRQSLDSTIAERDQLQAESQAQFAAAEAMRQQLQQSLDKTSAERDRLQAESRAHSAHLQTIKLTLQRVTADLDQRVKQIQALQVRLDDAATDLAALRGTAEGLQQQLQQARQDTQLAKERWKGWWTAERDRVSRLDGEKQLLLAKLSETHAALQQEQLARQRLDERLPHAVAARGAGLDLGEIRVGALRDTPPHRELAFELPHCQLPDRTAFALQLRLVEHNGHPGLVVFGDDNAPPYGGWQASGQEDGQPFSLLVPADADSRERLDRLGASDWLLLQAVLNAVQRALAGADEPTRLNWTWVLTRLRAALDALPTRVRHDHIGFDVVQAAQGGALQMQLRGVDCAAQRQRQWELTWWPAAAGGDLEWQLDPQSGDLPPLVQWPAEADGRPSPRHRITAASLGSATERRLAWLALPEADLRLLRAVHATLPGWVAQAAQQGVTDAAQARAWTAAAQVLATRIDTDLRLPLWRRVARALRQA